LPAQSTARPKKPAVLSVRRDPAIDRAMKVLEHTGMTQTEITRYALQMAAFFLDHAWRTHQVPVGVIPDIRVTQYRAPEWLRKQQQRRALPGQQGHRGRV
jgi:hypothetical protein